MNRAEAQANNRAIDSLINYETVKYCGNEEHEVARYDECMAKYQVRCTVLQTVLCLLVIVLTCVECMTKYQVRCTQCHTWCCTQRCVC
jgi:ATP-binding cassette subfamily B protein